MSKLYKDVVKLFTPGKKDYVIVQHEDESYIVCLNGHVAARMSEYEYTSIFHYNKPLVFPTIPEESAMKNGETVSKFGFHDLFSSYEYGETLPVLCSPYKFTTPAGDDCRIFISPATEAAIMVNSKYSGPFESIQYIEFSSKGGPASPVFCRVSETFVALLLPVRNEDPSGMYKALMNII